MSFIRNLAHLKRPVHSEPVEWLIVGLGNPGAQYARTRHNIGFMCSNRIAQRAGVRFHFSSKDRADIARASIGGHGVLLVQPQTYMNESGSSILRIRRRTGARPERILLIYDDVDLEFGTIRVRQAGSSGGQRGVKSIIDSLGTSEIPRIRVGIGRSSSATRDHVLTEFSPEQCRDLDSLCEHVAKVAVCIVADGVIAAMNRFNGNVLSTSEAR